MDKDERDRLFNERVQEVKKAIPIKDYLTISKSGLYNCPFCGSGTKVHMTGAFEVYDDNTGYCHSCHNEAIDGRPADNIALEMNASGSDFMTAFSLLANKAGIAIDDIYPSTADTPAEAVKRPQSDFNGSDRETDTAEQKTPAGAKETAAGAGADYTPYYKECAARITDPAAAAYLQGRGISQETAQAYHLGFDPQADPAAAPGGRGEIRHPAARIIVPTTAAHYAARAIDQAIPKQYQKMNVKGSTPGIFNRQALYAQDAQEVFVTEGAFDALSVLEAGAAAIALNSAGNVNLLINQLTERATEATLVICFDNDQDEKTRAQIEKEKQSLEQGLQAIGTRYIEADICGIYGDANEYLQNDRAGFIKAVHEAQSAAEAAAAEGSKSEIDSLLSVIFTERYKPQATGIYAIDKVTNGGFIPQTLILLGAEAGTGKTTLATMIFESMAKAGIPGIYFNLEMSKEQMLARSLARIVYTHNHNIKLTAVDILQGYKLTEQDKDRVLQAAQEYKETIEPNLQYNPDGISADVDEILKYINAKGAEAQAAGKAAPNICVDYLHLLKGNGKEDAAEIVKRATAGLKEYAMKYGAIVFCIIAQNRQANNSKQATLDAGRDSSALEYTADLQLQLIRENETDDSEITLHITKSRFTQTHMKDGVKFHLNGDQSCFEEFPAWEQAQGKTPFENEGKRRRL